MTEEETQQEKYNWTSLEDYVYDVLRVEFEDNVLFVQQVGKDKGMDSGVLVVKIQTKRGEYVTLAERSRLSERIYLLFFIYQREVSIPVVDETHVAHFDIRLIRLLPVRR